MKGPTVNLPFPEYHSNPETFKQEEVFVFTCEAIVPVKKPDPPPAPSGEENVPPAVLPDEGTQG